jgi:hypothetical protein
MNEKNFKKALDEHTHSFQNVKLEQGNEDPIIDLSDLIETKGKNILSQTNISKSQRICCLS